MPGNDRLIGAKAIASFLMFATSTGVLFAIFLNTAGIWELFMRIACIVPDTCRSIGSAGLDSRISCCSAMGKCQHTVIELASGYFFREDGQKCSSLAVVLDLLLLAPGSRLCSLLEWQLAYTQAVGHSCWRSRDLSRDVEQPSAACASICCLCRWCLGQRQEVLPCPAVLQWHKHALDYGARIAQSK